MCVVLLLLLVPESALAGSRPCVPAKTKERFRVDFKEVPLKTITRLVSCALEWNIVFQPSQLANRKVTVVAPKPVGVVELRQLYEALLRSQSLKMRRAGRYRIITPR